jgi:hypothetical protein
MENDILSFYTLYFNPKDYPGEYVVRRFTITSVDPNKITTVNPVPDKELFMRGTREEIEKKMFDEMGLAFLAPLPDEDPVIVGTFL